MTYDERAEPTVREQLLQHGMTGAVIVPLLLQEKVVGTMNLIFNGPRPLAEHERETLLAIGNTIALAIANARYVEHIKHVVEERERAEYAERRQRILAQTLATTAAVVNSTLDLERVLDAILTSIESVVNYDACSIMLIHDSDSRVVRGRGYDQYQSTQAAMSIHFPVGDTTSIKHMVQSGQPYLVHDTKHDPDWVIVPGMEWVASYLGIPIQVEGDVIGVLNLDSATPHAFTQADARILQAFADQAAIALRNARLYQASRRRQQYLATLRRVSRRSVPERSPRRFMQAVVQALVDEFGYAGAIIMLGDAEKREMRVGASAYDPSIKLNVDYSTYRQSYDSGIYGWVIRNEYPRLVRDTTLEPDFLLVDVNYKSVVAVPVRQYGKAIGVLAVSSLTKNAFDEADQEVMVEMADELALSLENVTLNEKAEQYAADLEQRVKERTAEVESERAQLRVILDSMNEGVIGVILGDPPSQYVNMALLKLLGCDAETWDPALLWPPEYIHETERVYDTVMEQGIWQGEHRLRRRDGSIFDAAMAVIRIGDVPPNAHGVVTIIRDISQEKELEAKKARFVANASHELRTPITNLITRLYLLRHDAGHLQDHIPIQEHVAQRMKQLVEDMLEYSRFERGVIPIKPAAVDVRTLLADVVDIQRAEAERKHITLNLDLPDTPLVVQIDPSRMNQV
ncbi:MAG: GAF domain-containing protein, partial [Anaerolineae bacterium]|nr:GAF domain-containing protein [Anaerolineae bacterium]